MGKGRSRPRRALPEPQAGARQLMGTTQAIYYRDSRGNEPVDAFIDGLKPEAQEAVDQKIDLLNGLPEDAPPLAFPHSSQVDGALRELRCHYGRTHYRILYRRSGNLFILLHAIEKRTDTLPPGDTATAHARFADFRARMDAKPRVPPRAAGHDAPPEHRG